MFRTRALPRFDQNKSVNTLTKTVSPLRLKLLVYNHVMASIYGMLAMPALLGNCVWLLVAIQVD